MATHIERAAQIRDLVQSEPGLNSREVARRLGVSPATVCLVLAELKSSGDVRAKRQGRGQALYPSDQALRRKYLSQRWR